MSNASSRQQTPDIQPVIAELLRTCVHPPVLPLQVDHVVRQPTTNGVSKDTVRHGYVTKLFLTDGELLIQALLHRKLSTLPEIEDLNAGDIVEIHDFVVKKVKRRNGRGHVVFLGVENCYVIKQETKTRVEEKLEKATSASSLRDRTRLANDDGDLEVDELEQEMAGGFFRDESIASARAKGGDKHSPWDEPSNQSLEQKSLSTFPTITPPRSSNRKRKHTTIMVDSDSDNGFETASVDMSTVKRRRQVLHELDRNIVSSPNRPSTREHAVPSKLAASDTNGRLTDHLPRNVEKTSIAVGQFDGSITNTTDNRQLVPPRTSIHSSQPSPWGPFRPLASLYSPSLPAKSFVLTTLVVPTYVSSHLISRPNGPLPAKRHIKIIDPSLASRLKISGSNLSGRGITVSVFRDALGFKPAVGHVALLRGLVMQRLRNGEVILNVYPAKSRIQIQSQTRSQSQVTNGSRPPSRHAHFADDPVVTDATRENEAKSLLSKDTQVDSLLTGNRIEEEPAYESSWFIDDHKKLRELGYDVDGMQQWWNGNLNRGQ